MNLNLPGGGGNEGVNFYFDKMLSRVEAYTDHDHVTDDVEEDFETTGWLHTHVTCLLKSRGLCWWGLEKFLWLSSDSAVLCC